MLQLDGGDVLIYYKKQQQKQMKIITIMNGCTIVISNTKTWMLFCISLVIIAVIVINNRVIASKWNLMK